MEGIIASRASRRKGHLHQGMLAESSFALTYNEIARLTIYGALKYSYDSRLANGVWVIATLTFDHVQIPLSSEIRTNTQLITNFYALKVSPLSFSWGGYDRSNQTFFFYSC